MGETKHGLRRHHLYPIWQTMKQRCENPSNCSFSRYGAKGVSVCDRWRDSFPNFLADMGDRPSPQHQIDRIDPFGDYEPPNCRWATPKENMRNTRRASLVNFKGVMTPVADVQDALGITRHKALLGKTGYKPNTARTRPGIYTGNRRLVTHNGETLCVREWAQRAGVSEATMSRRVEKRLTGDELLGPLKIKMPPRRKRVTN